ncbi:MAG: transporter substrate-binding domain-containing protein [Intestinibacillus sp.]
MKLTRFLGLAMAGALSLSLLAGCGGDKGGAAASDLDKVQKAGKLNIGYTVYEPMNYTDADGKFTGFDTEFAEAVCEKLGVEPNFVEINWDTKVVELDSGNIDCIWNGMTITDDLKQNISISNPYVQNKQVLVTLSKNKDTYADTANLKGKTVAVETGSAGQSVAEEDENLKDNLLTVGKQTDALLEIQSGSADAAVFDWTLAQNMIGEGTDFSDLVIAATLMDEQYGIGFRKDSDLCDKVNEIMAGLQEDGTLSKLAEKYSLQLA